MLAFAGIADPDKFFATLTESGAEIVQRRSFPDHHSFSERELAALLTRANREDLLAVTTAKDAVRIPAALRVKIQVADVSIRWSDPQAIDGLLTKAMTFAGATGRSRGSSST